MSCMRPSRPRLRRLVAMAAMLTLAGIAPPAAGQSASHPSTLRRQIYRAFDVGSWEDAVELIELYLEKVPNDSAMLYNAACAHCRLNNLDTAASYLYRAMKAGYRDLERMRDDPDLQGLRDHPTYKRIFETLDGRDENRSADLLEQWRESYGSPEYHYETDRKHRIQYATALDEVTHDEMRAMLEAEADHLIATLFEAPPRHFVLIAVPTPEHADRYFNGDAQIGGIYQHSRRTLVARNIGGSLRHEFFHAMHYGHMDRLDQFHRLWVQEGLAALYEDYELRDDGSITFLPNERHNITRSRAKAGRLYDWSDIFAMNSEEFMRRAKYLYPQVRSMFRYVAEQGNLVSWYRAYTRNFGRDPSGAIAFEAAFDKPVREIERDWRRWVISQPALDMEIGNGDAALGIRSGHNLRNDGVLVTDVLPNSAAEAVGLEKGDVIVAVDGQDTRTMRALQVAIGSKRVGEFVELRVQRDGVYFAVTVQLRPMTAGF